MTLLSTQDARRVIEKYPNTPVAKYAMFVLRNTNER